MRAVPKTDLGKNPMPTASSARQFPCERCPLRGFDIFRNFSAEEVKFLNRFKVGELKVEAGGAVLNEGGPSPHFYTVLTGWGIRYKMLEDGQRQILNICLPGDLVGLQSAVLHDMQHSVSALTDMLFCVFERRRIWELYSKQPSLAFDVTWLAAREEQMLDEHLLSVGQRGAKERISYFLLFVFARARDRGLTRGNSINLPITQQHIADTLGLSLVHTNRILNQLSRRGLIKWENRQFRIADRPNLEDLAGWRPPPDRERPYL
jgi:CRP/FNR family transcriptional regulator, anaerobic regulatory protein